MTPAINAVKKARIKFTLHEYAHDAGCASYGKEAADRLHLSEARLFKTLVVALDGKEFAVGVLPVSSMLSLKRIATAAGAKKAAMALRADVERATGYVLGGVSPLGQKKRLRTLIDESAQGFATVFVSAGRRGLQTELRPLDLKTLTNGIFAQLCQ